MRRLQTLTAILLLAASTAAFFGCVAESALTGHPVSYGQGYGPPMTYQETADAIERAKGRRPSW